MPLLKHAIKKMRQDARRRKVNLKARSGLKSLTKKASENPSSESLSKAFSALDKAVKTNLIHKNTAARKKSSLAKKLKVTKKPASKGKKTTNY